MIDLGKTFIVLRGAAGSGKSTWANAFPTPKCVISTDSYFIRGYEYKFDPSLLGYYHKLSFDKAQWLIDRHMVMIILDNTNIKLEHYSHYVQYAQDHGYTVYQKVFDGEFESIHNVPAEVVSRMRSTFQVDDTLPFWEDK